MSKMPCSISDGPDQEDVPEYIEQDGDAVYNELRQQEVDDEFRKKITDEAIRDLEAITRTLGELK